MFLNYIKKLFMTEFELQPVLSTACITFIVDSLNVKRELRSKRVKQFCQLFRIMYTVDIPNDISWFAT